VVGCVPAHAKKTTPALRATPPKEGNFLCVGIAQGFEPLDILQSVDMLLTQYAEGRCEVENQYSRVVRPGGNPEALRLMGEVFTPRETFEWRGLGEIPGSGYRLSDAYQRFDAELHFELPAQKVADNPACQCGSVLTGQIKPWECKVFGTSCTPEHPIGTCMVSPEGACAAYYTFGRLSKQAASAVV